MISRLKGVIVHDHYTKVPRENGEGTTRGWGTRPSPKAKPFEEDFGDTLTRSWENSPNLGKDIILTHGWENSPTLGRISLQPMVGGSYATSGRISLRPIDGGID